MRAFLTTAVLASLPLVACTARDVAITPDPSLPARQEERSPQAPRETERQGAPEIAIPKPANGVLSPGAADAVLKPGQRPLLRVLDAGADPKSDLSYALTQGPAPKLGMSIDMAMAIKSKGQSLPQMPLPRMTMVFDFATAEKNPAGDARIDAHLASVGVEASGGQQEQMARALRPQLDAMKGLGMGYWLTPKGQVRDAKIDMPPSVPPAAQQIMSGMTQSLESMVTPLPAEAVGVGARWQVVTRVTSGGADILQSSVYTLRSRAGAHATLDVTILQLAASDTIRTPQMPAGMSARVKSFSSGGTGRNQLDLGSVTPDGGTVAIKTTMEIGVVGAGATPGDDSTIESNTTVQMARP